MESMTEPNISERPSVVVADDDRGFALHLRDWFSARGYVTEVIDDPEQLERRLGTEPPELLVLDQQLRGVNPINLMRLLRRNKGSTFSDVLLVTDGPVDETVVKTLEAGADDFLRRPFSDLELEAVVSTLTRRSRTLRDVSPLTGLPGNHRCTLELRRRIDFGQPVALAHADLDHFKPFNDHYGFLRGDQVIKFAAHIIQEALAAADRGGTGFVGHIGGDDFMVLLDPDDAEEFSSQVVESFDDGILDFYDPEDALRGYIELQDRRGGRQAFPPVTISLGVATSRHRPFASHFEASTIASEMKEYAKASQGSTYEIDRRGA